MMKKIWSIFLIGIVSVHGETIDQVAVRQRMQYAAAEGIVELAKKQYENNKTKETKLLIVLLKSEFSVEWIKWVVVHRNEIMMGGVVSLKGLKNTTWIGNVIQDKTKLSDFDSIYTKCMEISKNREIKKNDVREKPVLTTEMYIGNKGEIMFTRYDHYIDKENESGNKIELLSQKLDGLF